jgi:hypothetical protein
MSGMRSDKTCFYLQNSKAINLQLEQRDHRSYMLHLSGHPVYDQYDKVEHTVDLMPKQAENPLPLATNVYFGKGGFYHPDIANGHPYFTMKQGHVCEDSMVLRTNEISSLTCSFPGTIQRYEMAKGIHCCSDRPLLIIKEDAMVKEIWSPKQFDTTTNNHSPSEGVGECWIIFF